MLEDERNVVCEKHDCLLNKEGKCIYPIKFSLKLVVDEFGNFKCKQFKHNPLYGMEV